MPADGRCNQALACPARGPLHHQRTHIGRPGKEVLALGCASLENVTASRERLHRREQWSGKTIPATPLPRCRLLRFQCPGLSADRADANEGGVKDRMRFGERIERFSDDLGVLCFQAGLLAELTTSTVQRR